MVSHVQGTTRLLDRRQESKHHHVQTTQCRGRRGEDQAEHAVVQQAQWPAVLVVFVGAMLLLQGKERNPRAVVACSRADKKLGLMDNPPFVKGSDAASEKAPDRGVSGSLVL